MPGFLKGLIMMCLGGAIIAGAALFIVGHFENNMIADSIQYADQKIDFLLSFGDFFVTHVQQSKNLV